MAAVASEPTPVQQAGRLVDEGRHAEAIRLLTEANRRRPDGEVEKRLVSLRHQAFEHLDGAGRATWPPPYPDCFPDVVGLPEVAADELTAEAVGGGILHHGGLIVRGFAGPERVERLIRAVDEAFAAYDRGMEKPDQAPELPWFAKFVPGPGWSTGAARSFVRGGGGVWTADSPRALFEVTETFEDIGLRDTLTDYFGEPPAMSVKKCTLRRVPIDAGTDWHQDGAFLGDEIRTVNVWLALTACGADADAPGLDVVPRRFDRVLETGTHGAKFDWSVGPGLVEQEAAGVPVVRPVFVPGDALLFDQRFVHRTGIGENMRRERYAIENWFFAPSEYPADQVPMVF